MWRGWVHERAGVEELDTTVPRVLWFKKKKRKRGVGNWSIWRRTWCPDGIQIFIFNMREKTLVCILISKIQNREKNWQCRREAVTRSRALRRQGKIEGVSAVLQKNKASCVNILLGGQNHKEQEWGWRACGREGMKTNMREYYRSDHSSVTNCHNCLSLKDIFRDAISEKLGSPHTEQDLCNGPHLPSENSGKEAREMLASKGAGNLPVGCTHSDSGSLNQVPAATTTAVQIRGGSRYLVL